MQSALKRVVDKLFLVGFVSLIILPGHALGAAEDVTAAEKTSPVSSVAVSDMTATASASVPAPGPMSAVSAVTSSKINVSVESATVKIFNREIITFRSFFLGQSPAQRAAHCETSLKEYLSEGGALAITVKDNPIGKMVMLDQHLAFVITPADVNPLSGQTLQQTTQQAVQRLEKVISETQESRNMGSLLHSLALSAIACAIYFLLLIAVNRWSRYLEDHLFAAIARQANKLFSRWQNIFETHALLPRLRLLTNFFRKILIALFTYQWISFILLRFPYTRPWGEQLKGYLYSLFTFLVTAAVNAMPGLILAGVIFLIGHFFVGFSARILTRFATNHDSNSWLNQETLPVTRRLFAIAIWLFTLAMAYPYIPGSQSEAFKGLSVMLGLMASLGSSSVIGQGAAGLILTYTRTIRIGEYLSIGDQEGTVTEVGMFTTRIRTAANEVISLPNSMVASTVIRNFSRSVQGRGYIVTTTVTIGYDTPWRQVEAMLTEAARRTRWVTMTPAPKIYQVALSDFYPEYRLAVQTVPEQPATRPEIVSQLHANIQDVFNEYGVQIMSPHYREDPVDAKIVPPENWYRAPAQREEK